MHGWEVLTEIYSSPFSSPMCVLIYLSTLLSIHLFIHPSIHPSFHLFLPPSLSPSLPLPTFLPFLSFSLPLSVYPLLPDSFLVSPLSNVLLIQERIGLSSCPWYGVPHQVREPDVKGQTPHSGRGAMPEPGKL